MKLNIDLFNKRPNPEIEEYARNRLNLAVGRYHKRLGRIEVRIGDDNARKGGVDKNCSIDAALVPRGRLHVHATESDVHEAILKAARRLETVLSKTVDRGHRGATIRHQKGGLRRENHRIVDSQAED